MPQPLAWVIGTMPSMFGIAVQQAATARPPRRCGAPPSPSSSRGQHADVVAHADLARRRGGSPRRCAAAPARWRGGAGSSVARAATTWRGCGCGRGRRARSSRGRGADHLAVLAHRLAGRDGAGGDLVAAGDGRGGPHLLDRSPGASRRWRRPHCRPDAAGRRARRRARPRSSQRLRQRSAPGPARVGVDVVPGHGNADDRRPRRRFQDGRTPRARRRPNGQKDFVAQHLHHAARQFEAEPEALPLGGADPAVRTPSDHLQIVAGPAAAGTGRSAGSGTRRRPRRCRPAAAGSGGRLSVRQPSAWMVTRRSARSGPDRGCASGTCRSAAATCRPRRGGSPAAGRRRGC